VALYLQDMQESSRWVTYFATRRPVRVPGRCSLTQQQHLGGDLLEHAGGRAYELSTVEEVAGVGGMPQRLILLLQEAEDVPQLHGCRKEQCAAVAEEQNSELQITKRARLSSNCMVRTCLVPVVCMPYSTTHNLQC